MMRGSIYIKLHKNSAEFSAVWRFAIREVRTGLLARCCVEINLRGLSDLVARSGLVMMEAHKQQLYM